MSKNQQFSTQKIICNYQQLAILNGLGGLRGPPKCAMQNVQPFSKNLASMASEASEATEAGLGRHITLRGPSKSAMQNVQSFSKTLASMASKAAEAGLT